MSPTLVLQSFESNKVFMAKITVCVAFDHQNIAATSNSYFLSDFMGYLRQTNRRKNIHKHNTTLLL